MLSSSENVFPTEIKIFQFNISEMQPLIDEVLSKKKEIKKISDVFSDNGNFNKNV